MLPWGEVQAPFTHSIELAAREHANRPQKSQFSNWPNKMPNFVFSARHNLWYRWFNNKKKKRSMQLMLSLIRVRAALWTTNAKLQFLSGSACEIDQIGCDNAQRKHKFSIRNARPREIMWEFRWSSAKERESSSGECRESALRGEVKTQLRPAASAIFMHLNANKKAIYHAIRACSL